MKAYRMVVAGILGVMLASAAHADVTYVCTYGQKERLIAVTYDNQASALPCEVRYTKGGATEVLWSANTQAGYCEEKARAFVDQHIDWGWRCGGGELGGTPQVGMGTHLSSEDIDGYRRNAHIANAISTASLLRLEVTTFYAEYGRYPVSVEELGHRPEDMRTSSHFSDLRIGDGGTILIQGNQNTGTDTVIALRPREALGGMSMEWDCAINIEIGTGIQCSYEPGLRFR